MSQRSKSGWYVLDERGNPEPCDDIGRVAKFFSDMSARRVARDDVGDATTVSTVFLASDHGYLGGDPILWETMVFGGPLDGDCDRYESREDAIRGHARMVERVREAQKENRPHPEG